MRTFILNHAQKAGRGLSFRFGCKFHLFGIGGTAAAGAADLEQKKWRKLSRTAFARNFPNNDKY